MPVEASWGPALIVQLQHARKQRGTGKKAEKHSANYAKRQTDKEAREHGGKDEKSQRSTEGERQNNLSANTNESKHWQSIADEQV